jgi:hypothetical protein
MPRAAENLTEGNRASAEPAPLAEMPGLALNSKANYPMPLAPVLATLSVKNGCLILTNFQGDYQPIWPSDARWVLDQGRPAIASRNRIIRLDQQVSLAGADVTGFSDITFEERLGSKCPRRTFGLSL